MFWKCLNPNLRLLLTWAARLQLVGGSSQCSGRLEVFYKGQWGTVCDDDWEMSSADMVCKQLGCGHAVSAPTGAHFGRGSGPIWLDNVVCTGEESALTHCTHNGFGINNCGHGEDAGVICLGKRADSFWFIIQFHLYLFMKQICILYIFRCFTETPDCYTPRSRGGLGGKSGNHLHCGIGAHGWDVFPEKHSGNIFKGEIL